MKGKNVLKIFKLHLELSPVLFFNVSNVKVAIVQTKNFYSRKKSYNTHTEALQRTQDAATFPLVSH